ncbi:MAG: SAM hydrolase/SAM-dependent halogenase family protein [Pseudonocardiaceae bacterium]
MRYGWISFTTDYGLDDPFVGVCHGVIAGIAHEARVIDITHGVPAGDIRQGAHALAQAVPYLPTSVHLAVVDPGVGTARRGVVIVAPEGVLVGPDNGLLTPAAEVLGGIERGFELTNSSFRLPTVSATFHGRDVFAPAAAHLASGVPPEDLGPPLSLHDLERLPSPAPTVRDGSVITEVLCVDHFGNIQLAAAGATLADAGFAEGEPVTVRVGQARHTGVVGSTFADVQDGDLVVLADSAGLVELAINGASAATRMGLVPGHSAQECTITASPTATRPGRRTA